MRPPSKRRRDEVVGQISEALPPKFGLAKAMAAVRVAYMTGYMDAQPKPKDDARPER